MKACEFPVWILLLIMQSATPIRTRGQSGLLEGSNTGGFDGNIDKVKNSDFESNVIRHENNLKVFVKNPVQSCRNVIRENQFIKESMAIIKSSGTSIKN